MKPYAALVTLVVLSGPVALAGSEQSAPQTLSVAGVTQPVEIRRDRWGINHIYAQNEQDLFFAQGYAAARDRLFQFELWRRQATGTLAEVVGQRELERDRGARLHMYRGDLDAELNHYHPHGKAIIESFVRGVNAYIAEVERNPSLLPIELKMLGMTPGRWTPAVVISRHQSLTANVTEEARLMRALKHMPADQLKDLIYCQGGNPEFGPDPALDPKIFPDDVLSLYNAFREAVEFKPEDVLPEYRGSTQRASALPTPASRLPTPDEDLINPRDIGSNNWVVSGSKTQSTLSDPRQRSAPRAGRTVAALLGAPRGAGLERDRRRRAGAARRSRSATTSTAPGA